MYSIDFLYYSLGIGFLTLVGFMCYMLFHLTKSIKSLNEILEKVDSVTDSVELISSQVKWALYHLAGKALKKGGEILNGKKKRKKT